MTAPSERQVLYALVGLGFHVVVAVLVIGAEVAGLVPGWWTITMGVAWVGVAAVVGPRWRRTGRVLAATILLFVVWTVGTLVVA
jgi:hypothetical protein